MNITSPDLSVLNEFQWLIGLFRSSISPVKQRQPQSRTRIGTEGGTSLPAFGKTLCGLFSPKQMYVFLAATLLYSSQELWATLVSTALPGPVTMPCLDFLSVEKWTWDSSTHPVCFPRSPGQGCWEGLQDSPSQSIGGNWGWDRLQGSHPLSSAKAGPGFSILSLHRCDIIRNFNSFYSQKGHECVWCGFLVCTLIRTGRGSKVIC